MKSISLHRPWHSLMAAFLIPLLAFLLACGPGEEPTPIPTATAAPTATATTAPGTTPTPTSPGPVATPTPTSVVTPTPTPSEQPKRGGRVLLTVGAYMPDYDVHVTLTNGDPNSLGGKLYNNLFINPERDTTECEICTEWHLENGGKTMVFNLIQGIKFHNGQEMTSADVKWSLRKIMGEVDGIVSPRVGVIKEYVESIETPSRYVLRINLVRPSAFLPKVLSMTHAPIYPEGTTHVDLLKEPKGTGPFILGEIIPGASRKLDRNPNYFKPGLPYLDGWELVVVGDAATRFANFLTHKTQVSAEQTPQYQPQLRKLVEEGKMNFDTTPDWCGPVGVYMTLAKPPFNDLTMRKAVNLALNRKPIGNLMFRGLEQPQLMGGYTKGMEFATPEEQIWDVVPGWGTGAKKQQEIEEAKKLVIQAGYSNGLDIPQLASSPLATFGVTSGQEAVQQQLGVVGIRTTLDLTTSVVFGIRMLALDYSMMQYVFCIPTKDPDEVIGTYWLTGSSRNVMGYINPEVDRLFPLMSGELDPQKRKEIFLRIQKIIVLDTVGYAPLQSADGYLWWWKSLGGFAPSRDGLQHGASGWHRGDRVWLGS